MLMIRPLIGQSGRAWDGAGIRRFALCNSYNQGLSIVLLWFTCRHVVRVQQTLDG